MKIRRLTVSVDHVAPQPRSRVAFTVPKRGVDGQMSLGYVRVGRVTYRAAAWRWLGTTRVRIELYVVGGAP